MTISFVNPFAEKLREKYIEEDKLPSDDKDGKIKIREEIDKLHEESRAYAETKIKELQIRLDKVIEVKESVGSAPRETANDIKGLIKQVADGYREALELHFWFREVKKELKRMLEEKK